MYINIIIVPGKHEDYKISTNFLCAFCDLHFRMRLNGLEFRDYGNRIMKKVFEGTPLQSLNDTIFVATNCQLFGKNINAIKAIITECEKTDWLIPIGDFFF